MVECLLSDPIFQFRYLRRHRLSDEGWVCQLVGDYESALAFAKDWRLYWYRTDPV